MNDWTELGWIERSVVNPRVWVPVSGDNDSSSFLYAGTKRQALQFFGWPGPALRLEREDENRIGVWSVVVAATPPVGGGQHGTSDR